jgi:hypothetical protein
MPISSSPPSFSCGKLTSIVILLPFSSADSVTIGIAVVSVVSQLLVISILAIFSVTGCFPNR